MANNLVPYLGYTSCMLLNLLQILMILPNSAGVNSCRKTWCWTRIPGTLNHVNDQVCREFMFLENSLMLENGGLVGMTNGSTIERSCRVKWISQSVKQTLQMSPLSYAAPICRARTRCGSTKARGVRVPAVTVRGVPCKHEREKGTRVWRSSRLWLVKNK